MSDYKLLLHIIQYGPQKCTLAAIQIIPELYIIFNCFHVKFQKLIKENLYEKKYFFIYIFFGFFEMIIPIYNTTV